MSGPVIHATPHGRYLVARRLPDGRYVAPVHAAFWALFGHFKVGCLDDVIPVAYVYASLSNARDRARALFPLG